MDLLYPFGVTSGFSLGPCVFMWDNALSVPPGGRPQCATLSVPSRGRPQCAAAWTLLVFFVLLLYVQTYVLQTKPELVTVLSRYTIYSINTFLDLAVVPL